MARPIRLLAIAVFLSPGVAFAQQLVVFDEVYTAVQKEGGGDAFHHSVRPADNQPANWVSPVDYSKGTVYIHQEVMTKPPGNRNTLIDICFDGDLEGYGCIDTAPYTAVGVHETMKPLTDMWQYEKVAWTRKRTVFHLVIKDPALGGTPGGKPPTEYVPSTMRIVLTLVPPGGKYVPPQPGAPANVDGGGAPSPDAGAIPPPTPVDAAAPAAPPDAAVYTPPPADAAVTATPSPPTTEPTAPEQPRFGGCNLGGQGSDTAGVLVLAGVMLALVRRRR